MKFLTNDEVCPVIQSQTDKEQVTLAIEAEKEEVRTATAASTTLPDGPYVKNGKVIGIPFHSVTIRE